MYGEVYGEGGVEVEGTWEGEEQEVKDFSFD